MSRRRRIIESPERDNDEDNQDLEMMSTTSTSCAPSSFDVSVSEIEVSSIASQDSASIASLGSTSRGAPRTSWGWATRNKWAEHAMTKADKEYIVSFLAAEKST